MEEEEEMEEGNASQNKHGWMLISLGSVPNCNMFRLAAGMAWHQSPEEEEGAFENRNHATCDLMEFYFQISAHPIPSQFHY